MTVLRILLISCLLCILPETILAQLGDPIGQVLITQGTVTATNRTTPARALRRRSELLVGDTVKTAANGFITIRMLDGAVISLTQDTVFLFTEYHLAGSPGTEDKISLELQRGGVRSITGSIGDAKDDAYLLSTPATDLSIEGATYECVIVKALTTCGVYNGAITMTNPIDSVELGLGGNWDYAEVESRQHTHIPLLRQPAVLGQISLNPGAGQTTVSTPVPNSVTTLSGTVSLPPSAPIQITPYKTP